ncbi:MAG: tetratricopeptide repeat protein [Alphaproteobacteria bacterium]|nr:tetratricopeptide repeat protein [Alphaproteobacteria bacterium]
MTATERGVGRRTVAVLAAVAVLAWGVALLGPYQFDDAGVVVTPGAPGWLGAAVAGLSHRLRPVLAATYLADAALGWGPVGAHVVGLGIHAVVVGLVARVFVAARTDAPWGRGPWDAATWWVATVFALHPLHTEAVTYVAGRSASLSTAWMLLALLAVAEGSRRRSPAVWLGLAGAAGVLGLMTKEVAATLPLLVVGWQLVVARGPWGPRLGRATAWLGVAAAMGLGVLAHGPTYRLVLGLVGRVPLSEAVVRQLDAMGWLAGRFVGIGRPSIDPGFGFVDPDPMRAGVVAVAGIVAVLGAVGVWRRAPLVVYGLGWWGLTLLLPYVVLPRTDVLNERHAYLADVGLVWALGAGIAAVQDRWPAAVRRGLVVVAVALGVATGARNLDYRTELALWEQTTRASPANPRAWANLGAALERLGQLDAAETAYLRALAREPRDVQTHEAAQRVHRARGSRSP